MAQQFETVSSRYGAPMGRRADGFLETDVARFVRLYHVRINSGGYDDGGAYWGLGVPLFCAEDDDGNHPMIREILQCAILAALFFGPLLYSIL